MPGMCTKPERSQEGTPDHVKLVPPYSGRPGHAPPPFAQQPQAARSAAHAASVQTTPPTVPSMVFLDPARQGSMTDPRLVHSVNDEDANRYADGFYNSAADRGQKAALRSNTAACLQGPAGAGRRRRH